MDAERHASAPVQATSLPRRRNSDRLRPKDIVYLVGLLLVAGSLWLAVESDHRSERADRHATTALTQVRAALAGTQQALAKVQQGRKTSLSTICAVESAISEAGRSVITGSSLQDTPFTRALERLGYPPLAKRKTAAVKAGRLYVKTISDRVNRELQQTGKRPIPGLVRRDGTVDCQVLQRIAAVPNPR